MAARSRGGDRKLGQIVDGAFVLRWEAIYEQRMGATELRLFDRVGPTVAARGYYESDEFSAVAEWKTPRSRKRVAANTASDVREITSLAFAAPDALQHRVLTLLQGIGVPTATALLAVAFPDRHTVLDFRSTEALDRLDEWNGEGGYASYVAVCRRLAAGVKVSLRQLDRALWQWSKSGYQ